MGAKSLFYRATKISSFERAIAGFLEETILCSLNIESMS
jgi:hypothetical protein